MDRKTTIKPLIGKPLKSQTSITQTAASETVTIKNEILALHFDNFGQCLKSTCPKCNGYSIIVCKCAKNLYYKSINQDMINRYIDKKNILDPVKLANYVDTGKI